MKCRHINISFDRQEKTLSAKTLEFPWNQRPYASKTNIYSKADNTRRFPFLTHALDTGKLSRKLAYSSEEFMNTRENSIPKSD